MVRSRRTTQRWVYVQAYSLGRKITVYCKSFVVVLRSVQIVPAVVVDFVAV